MNAVLIIGRVLFALICLNAGINHFTHGKAMVGYAQFKKVPAAAIAVPLSGVLLFLGAASIILGVVADLGALVLAILLLVSGGAPFGLFSPVTFSPRARR